METGKTTLMPPLSAVHLLWGVTRHFSKGTGTGEKNEQETEDPGQTEDLFTKYIKPEIDQLLQNATENEAAYLRQVYHLLMAELRNAGIIYKGRQLNYAENRKIRDAYLASLEKNYDFSGIIKEALKNLPGVGGGSITGIVLLKYLAGDPGIFEMLLAAIIFGFIGYVFQLVFSRINLYYKHNNYIRQDLETTAYYEQYLERMVKIFQNLFDRIEAIHFSIFKKNYYKKNGERKSIAELILNENKADCCHLLEKHLKERIINSENWYRCEIGGPLSGNCPHHPPKNSNPA